MMICRRGILTILFYLLIVSVVCIGGCDIGKRFTSGKSVEITVLYPPSIDSYIRRVSKAFSDKRPVLPDGTAVKISFIKASFLTAVRGLSNGRIKAHGWVAPSKSIIGFANLNRAELGASLKECVQLFSTPVVLVNSLRTVGTRDKNQGVISIKEIIDDKDNNHYNVLIANPKVSENGFSSLIALSYGIFPSDRLTADKSLLKNGLNLRQMEALNTKVLIYKPSDDLVLEEITSYLRPDTYGVVSERSLVKFNSRLHDRNSRLLALYPKEGIYWTDYNLCTASAVWLAPVQKRALDLLKAFLASAKGQDIAKAEGFRPSVTVAETGTDLAEEFGITPSLKVETLLPPTAEFARDLINNWNKIKKPSLNIYILDTSGSMEGRRLRIAKMYMRELIAKSSPRDLKTLFAFSSRLYLKTKVTKEAGDIIPQIDRLRAVGGSAIYDTLKTAIEFGYHKNTGYQRNIVLVTDGSDKSSFITVEELTKAITLVQSEAPFNLFIIYIGDGPPPISLAILANKSRGLLFEAGLDNMAGYFDLVADYL